MPKLHRQLQTPYSAQQMYQLVNDIHAYPQFLPGCADAKILSQTPTHIVATLDMAWGGLKQSVTTENICVENQSIQMQFKEGPFKHLRGAWTFTPISPETCEVSLDLDFEWQSGLMGVAFGHLAAPITERLADVFLERARQLYGSSNG
jgi:ribosome-associated toxin RatA of RatAB toxin-antitoxin module